MHNFAPKHPSSALVVLLFTYVLCIGIVVVILLQ